MWHISGNTGTDAFHPVISGQQWRRWDLLRGGATL